MILAGDIGGTKTVVALFEAAADRVLPVCETTYPSREHATLEEIIRQFMAEVGDVTLEGVCLGVAGPVAGGRVRTTNLPWEIAAESLARTLDVPRVKLLNDLEATAYGMLFLDDGDTVALNPGAGTAPPGNIAVIAAGTGLGEALLIWDGTAHRPVATEGGHADFAPRTEREIALLRRLRRELRGHVSYERLLSGPGILNIYRFLREESAHPEPGWLTARLREPDPSAAVSRTGLAGEDEVCAETLRLFSSLYGAEAGNMALRGLAAGGVFVGGGIAPKILPVLEEGYFMEAFADKGRFAEFLRRVPVLVSRNPRAALIGCAHAALEE